MRNRGTFVRLGISCVVAFAAATAAMSAQQAAPTPGALSGVVQDALSGRPLAGAVVTLRTTTGPARERNRFMLTDEFGRFVFRDITPEDGLRVTVTRFGYVDGEYGQASVLAPGGVIALSDGEWFADADVLLWKPGAISGRVLDEHGEPMVGVFVRALARQHVAGRVQYLAAPFATTDDRGQYRVAGLPPGTFVIQVPSVQASVPAAALAGGISFERPGEIGLRFSSLPPRPPVDAALDPSGSARLIVGTYPVPPAADGTPQAYPATFNPGVLAAHEALTIEIGPGEHRADVDVTVRAVPTANVFGAVDGPAEALEGLVLRLMPAALEDLGFGGEAATALVAPDGTFAFLNVPAGDYVINGPKSISELLYLIDSSAPSLPQAPGMSVRSSRTRGVDAGVPGVHLATRGSASGQQYWVRAPVTVGRADVTDLVVTLQPERTLAGEFIYDGSTRLVAVQAFTGMVGSGQAALGTVPVPMERPARPPGIEFEPADGLTRHGSPRSNPVQQGLADDAFEVSGVRDGEYVVRVRSTNDSFSVKLVTIDGVDYTHRPVDATRLGPSARMHVVLTDQVNTVRGLVRDGSGPTIDAAVIAFPVERDQWSRYGFSPVRIRAVTVAGRSGYELRGLPAGEYFVAAVDRRLITAWQDPAFLEGLAGRASRVSLTWGEAKTVDLDLVRVR